MTADSILEELRPLGSESYKRVVARHGVREPFFGVKVEDLKKIQKRIKVDYQLALDLYATGNSDAMYLAALIADDARMTVADLDAWVEKAYCPLHSECTVAWVAAGGPHALEVAQKWIESETEMTACAGWSTLGSWVGITPDKDIDTGLFERLLQRVQTMIHQQPNRVRSAMNGFVIAVGSSVPALTEAALSAGRAIGPDSVSMGETACQVPFAPDYIEKVRQRGAIGKKRKSAKC